MTFDKHNMRKTARDPPRKYQELSWWSTVGYWHQAQKMFLMQAGQQMTLGPRKKL